MTKILESLIDIKKFRSILCLNGEIPERVFFETDLPIIAADGAANKLVNHGIKPHAIIGDLDSVHDHIRDTHHTIHYADQNSNDYQKSLAYLEKNNLLPAIVVGIDGGYLDHALNNVNIFMQTDSVLYAPPLIGMVINAGEKKILTPLKNTKISLIGFPHAEISSNGLKWELHKQSLTFPGVNSCFNRCQANEIEIIAHQGTLLILIYLSAIDDAGL